MHPLADMVDAAQHDRRDHASVHRIQAVASRVDQRAAAVLVGFQVAHQPGFVAGQRGVLGGQDFCVGARHIPKADVVEAAGEIDVSVVVFDVRTEHQRIRAAQVVEVAHRAHAALDTVDDDAHLRRIAVHHQRDVVPVPGRHQAGVGLDRLLAGRITNPEPQAAVGVEPGGVDPHIVARRVAFVEDRRPGVGIGIDLDPGLDRHRLGEIQRRVRCDLGDVQTVEADCRADLTRATHRSDTAVAVDRDRHRFVGHFLHAEAVARGAGAAVAAAFDEQGVAAAELHRAQLRVVARHVGRAPDGAPEGVEQAPVRITAGGADDVEIQAFAGRRIEAIDIGLIGRGQRASDNGIEVDRGGVGGRQVEQAEAIGADGVGLAVDPQRVVAGHQGEDAGAVGRVAALHRAVGDHRAARAGQRPAHAGVVGQRVEVQPRFGVQREAVDIFLAKADIALHDARRARPDMADERVVATAGGVSERAAGAFIGL